VSDEHQSFAGNLLIAMPNLADPNFHRSVVLLGVHSPGEGAFGLIVNRLLNLDFEEVLEQLDQRSSLDVLPPILFGGPVEPEHGFVLFERGNEKPEEHALFSDDRITVSGNTETLRALISGSISGRFNLILGYSGWYPGQLEREIEENSWLVAPLDHRILFDTDIDNRWHEALASIGIDPGNLVDVGDVTPS
jgi:putative transcriptional regulator